MSSNDQLGNPTRRSFGIAAAGLTLGAVAGLTSGSATGQGTTAPVGPRRFEGKVVLVTGATSGIGRAAAVAFAREGAAVAFCGRRESLGREVEQQIADGGGKARFIKADVRVEAEVDALIAETIEEYGGLDIALNNAGVSMQGHLHETSTADWDNLQATNVRGVFLCMKAQIPHLLQRGAGQIIVTSSVNILATRPELFAYSASKRALAGLVQSTALDYAEKGIRINAICPGTTDTEMVRRLAGMMDVPDEAWRAGIGEWATKNVEGLRRVATAEEIATAILALASPDMGYMTGASVIVDGGMSAAL